MDSMAAVAAKAQQDPQVPWLRTGVTMPAATQLTSPVALTVAPAVAAAKPALSVALGGAAPSPWVAFEDIKYVAANCWNDRWLYWLPEALKVRQVEQASVGQSRIASPTPVARCSPVNSQESAAWVGIGAVHVLHVCDKVVEGCVCRLQGDTDTSAA